ncbi:MAG: hypothetical protein AAFY88_21290, partial [Acidobacteriota bacterium]
MLAERLRIHGAFAAASAWLAAVAVLAFGQPSTPVQIVGLGLGVLVCGVPHGALDHRPGRRVLSGVFGSRRWWGPFLVGYLVLGASVLAA